MMVYRSGGVYSNGGSEPVPFGTAHRKNYLTPLLTTGKDMEERVVPQFEPQLQKGWYLIKGKTGTSQFLEFDLTLNDASGYCFNTETTYELWHAEDISDKDEDDNGGTAYTDIYICLKV